MALILLSVLWWLLPLAIFVWIIRLIVRHRDHKPRRHATLRDILLSSIVAGAGYCGVAALFYLPLAVFGESADNAVFASRMATGVLLLVAGLFVKRLTGNFLMVMGIISILLALPTVFENLGSAGALLVVVAAFGGLVFAAIKVSKKEPSDG